MATIFTIKLIHDKAYKGYVAEVVNLPGCMSQGKTKDEAISNVKKAIGAFLKVIAIFTAKTIKTCQYKYQRI